MSRLGSILPLDFPTTTPSVIITTSVDSQAISGFQKSGGPTQSISQQDLINYIAWFLATQSPTIDTYSTFILLRQSAAKPDAVAKDVTAGGPMYIISPQVALDRQRTIPARLATEMLSFFVGKTSSQAEAVFTGIGAFHKNMWAQYQASKTAVATPLPSTPIIVNGNATVQPAKSNYLPYVIGGITAGIVSTIALVILAMRKR
jgi:hypothetical protein